MNHANADFLVGELFQRLGNGFYRALYVCLYDQRQLLHLALLNLAEQIIQCYLLVFVELGLLCFVLPLFYQFSCQTLVFYCVERIACLRHFCQTGDLYRYRRAGSFYCNTLVVGHNADAADRSTCDNHITGMECTILYQQGGNRAAALIQTGFYNSTLCTAIRICLEFFHICNKLCKSHASVIYFYDRVNCLWGNCLCLCKCLSCSFRYGIISRKIIRKHNF